MDQQQATPQPQPQQPQQPQMPSPNNELEFSFGAIFMNCWGYLKDNAATYLGLYAIVLIPTFLFGLVYGFVLQSSSNDFSTTTTIDSSISPVLLIFSLVVALVLLVLSLIVQAGIIASSLKIMRDKTKVSISEAFALGRSNFGTYFVASLMLGLILIGGFILLIVPGFIFLTWYYVATASAIDNKAGIGAALKDSKRLTEGNRLTILGVVIGVGILSSLLSAIPILGQIASVVLTLIASLFVPYIYVSLKELKDGGHANVAPAQATAPQTPQPVQPAPVIPPNQNTPSSNQQVPPAPQQ